MPLRLTLELVPRGNERLKKTVGTLEIENTADHPEHPHKANYKFRMTGPIDEVRLVFGIKESFAMLIATGVTGRM